MSLPWSCGSGGAGVAVQLDQGIDPGPACRVSSLHWSRSIRAMRLFNSRMRLRAQRSFA